MLQRANDTRRSAPFGNATKKFKGRFEFYSLPFAVHARR